MKNKMIIKIIVSILLAYLMVFIINSLISNTYLAQPELNHIIWIPTNHRLVKIKFHKHRLNGVHEAEPDTRNFHLFYN